MDEYRMVRRALMAEVTGGRVRGRRRLGWMDDVKVALGDRWMTVEAARQYAKDRKELRPLVHMQLKQFYVAIFAWPSLLLDRPPVLWWLSPGEGWDAVTWCGWDKLWKGRNYSIPTRRCQVYGLWRVCWWLYVRYLTWHDYPSLVEGESHGILLLSLYVIQH